MLCFIWHYLSLWLKFQFKRFLYYLYKQTPINIHFITVPRNLLISPMAMTHFSLAYTSVIAQLCQLIIFYCYTKPTPELYVFHFLVCFVTATSCNNYVTDFFFKCPLFFFTNKINCKKKAQHLITFLPTPQCTH